MREILENLSKIENINFVFKLHPREIHLEEYNKLVDEFPNTKINLLSECDLMINFFGSSTILEASILNKPSLTLEFPNLHQEFYGKDDPSTTIKYNENLKETIQNILNNPKINELKRKKVVEIFCYKVDGKAHQRVKEFIEELANCSTQHQVP